MSSERTLSKTSRSPGPVPPVFTVAELQDAKKRADVTIKTVPILRPTERDGQRLPTLAMFAVPLVTNAPDPLGGVRPEGGSYRRNMTVIIGVRVIDAELRGQICEQLSAAVSYDCHVSDQ
jgi:hypothetical protein